MNQFSIDINADLGEGFDNEAQLMPYISSCNIACGGHAGDLETMHQVVKLAKQHKVKIGAHPSFPDKDNFGRVPVDMTCAALYTSLKHQIDSFTNVLYHQQATMHHIKPHGALYNLAAVDEKIANVIIEVIKSMDLPIQLYVPYNSVIEKLALAEGIFITYEAFADRRYTDDLKLVSRKQENAIITNEKEVIEQVLYIIYYDKVKTLSGNYSPIKAQTFCIHGDNPEANVVLKKLHEKLIENGIDIK